MQGERTRAEAGWDQGDGEKAGAVREQAGDWQAWGWHRRPGSGPVTGWAVAPRGRGGVGTDSELSRICGRNGDAGVYGVWLPGV